MKKILLVLGALFLLSSCAAYKMTPTEKAIQRERLGEMMKYDLCPGGFQDDNPWIIHTPQGTVVVK
jgi:hypothetical protein